MKTAYANILKSVLLLNYSCEVNNNKIAEIQFKLDSQKSRMLVDYY